MESEGVTDTTALVAGKAFLYSFREMSLHLSARVRHIVTPNTILVGVVGVGALADGIYILSLLFRRRRCPTTSDTSCIQKEMTDEATLLDSSKCGDGGAACMVRRHWEQLSNAILEAPRTAPGPWKRPLPSEGSELYAELPEVVQLMWEDRVRYTMDTREVVSLLRKLCKSPPRESKYTTDAASLALLWRLQLLRTTHTSVVTASDAGRCSTELKELKNYANDLFRAFIFPLQSPMRGAFIECWEHLRSEESQLRSQVTALRLRNLWELVKYILSGGGEKLFTYGVVATMTTLAARSASAICVLRVGVEKALPLLVGSVTTVTSGGAASGGSPSGDEVSGSQYSTAIVVLRLLALEWLLHAVRLGIMRITQDYTRASASWRRDTVKQQLYDALIHTPLCYFDTTELYNVEELVYYVNDLEGVDVFVHDFILRLTQSATTLFVALQALNRRAGFAVAAAVVGTSLVNTSLGLLKIACRALRCRTESVIDHRETPSDAEEEENRKDSTDRLMFCGMEIIEHIPELRPHGADEALMGWWSKHTAHYRQRNCGLWHSVQLVHRFRHLWTLDALKPVVRWILPAFVAAYATGACQTQALVLEAVRSSQELLERVTDAQQVADVVMYNAYKAGVIGRILDPKYWEDKDMLECEGRSTESSGCVVNPVNESGEHDGVHGHDCGLDVCSVRAEGLQFQYPATPTVDAFSSPVTFCFDLKDSKTGCGRFVCITGPSGCGKTTLLRLLLALYTPNDPETLLVELQPRRQSGDETVGKECFGTDRRRWKPVYSWHRRCLRLGLFSYVPQTPTIFAGSTIAHNVSLHNRVTITDVALMEKVRACTEAAGCGSFVKRLPNGVMTQLCANTGWSTPDAVRLSFGQEQRLMLARALFRCSGVLLLDEPTAGLDKETKKVVMSCWRELMSSGRVRGVICATHDEEVLQMADEIVLL
uniref:WGS project CAEQ00000000 data, annotated contig 1227 n=1 Tax=Trypanosoma congolense (strain IL3000) TaxID=1068625 RepID=F9W4U0_TRYCI|nr:unnamed protein product [Trypanosoma congolense IL3000]